MGADSAASGMDDISTRRDLKLFSRGEFMFAFCGSPRAGQLLRYAFEIPVPPENDEQIPAYLVSEFATAFKKVLGEHGLLDEESEFSGSVMIGLRGHLYGLLCDFQISEEDGDGLALGSGRDPARGVLFCTEGLGIPAEDRVLTALEAAEHCISTVRRPFHMIEMSSQQAQQEESNEEAPCTPRTRRCRVHHRTDGRRPDSVQSDSGGNHAVRRLQPAAQRRK
jgi:hypothetical protein